jgi:hypothetical protein
MKLIKRLFIFLGILAILAVGSAAILPMIFKDELIAIVKEAANDNLNAKLDFGDVQLSLLRSFPKLSFKMDSLSIEGINEFEGLPLAKVGSIDLQLDVLSVLQRSKPIAVKSVKIDQPEIQVLVLKNGLANYNIAKASADTTASTAPSEPSVYKFNLNSYEINNGKLLYEDRASNLNLLIDQLQHSGSGAFDTNIFDLDAATKIDALSVVYDGMTYLKDAKVDWITTLGIDQSKNLYAIKENSLSVNALLVKLDGFIQMVEDGLQLNMNLSAPENEFKNLLSLIPNAYTQDFDDVQSDGKFVLEAFSNGTYKFDNSEYPPFNVKLNIDDGFVKYPGLPLPVQNIKADVAVNSPSSDLDDIRVEAPTISWNLDGSPFVASLYLQKPISDPDFESSLKGKIDLADVKKAFPGYLDDEMGGEIDMDMSLDARMSTIEQERYEDLKLAGTLKANNVQYPLDAYGYPAISVEKADVTFSPKTATIKQFNARAGASDLRGNGSINNILAYFSPEKTMTGTFTLASNFINADEWYPVEPSTTSVAGIEFEDTTAVVQQARPFDRFDFDVAMQADNIQYSIYNLVETQARASVKPDLIKVQNAFTKIKDSDFTASGTIENLFDYLYEEGTLGGTINLTSDLININSLYSPGEQVPPISPSESGPAEAFETPTIPPRIEMVIQTDVKEVKYVDISFKNLVGQLDILEQAAVLENMAAKALGGDILLSGQYNTQDKDKPYFSMKYDLQRLDFVESFKSANTFRQLNPIAEFIEGKYNTSLILDGQLGKNMYPVFSSLNAQGVFETIDGVIKGLAPLQKIGNLLKIEEFQNAVKIEDTRNFFEMKNGFMEVKPFDVVVEGIKMTIAGRHSLDKNLDYTISARVPRDMLDESGLGSLANEGLSVLQQQAQKLGIKIDDAPFINLGITLKGALSDPNVGVKVLGLSDGEGEVMTQTDSTAVQVGEILEEKVEEGKQEVKEQAEKAVDSAKTVVSEKVEAAKDTLSKKAEEKAKELLGIKDTSAVDSIKQALEKWNPFKKKKKSKN